MNETIHRPEPDFLAHLEWQTRTELRRSSRFAAEARAGRWARRTRSAALVLLSLVAGAGVVWGAERLQDTRELRLLEARNRIRLEAAERRTAAAERALERAVLLAEQGFVSTAEVLRARIRALELERVASLRALERDELAATRREVDSRLSAPTTRPRDFVMERLLSERDLVAKHVELAELDAARSRQLVEAGFATQSTGAAAAAELESQRLRARRIDERIALRSEFVRGGIGALECERRDLLGDAEARRDALRARQTRLEVELRRAESLEASGRASGAVEPLQSELADVESELALVALEIEALGAQ